MALTFQTGNTFSNGDSATSIKLNAMVNSATYTGFLELAKGGTGATALFGSGGIWNNFGVNNGTQLHSTTNGLTLGDTANIQMFVGQDSTHGLVTQWTYNASAGSALGLIATYGQNNALKFQASNFSFDTTSLTNAFQLVASGRAVFGGGVDDGSNALQTSTFKASGHLTVEGVTSTGATGTGNLVFSAAPTLTGTLNCGPVVSTGSITPSQTGGIVGTTTNNSANAGSVGEVITASVAQGSAVSLSNNSWTNITSITLTAGDWNIYGVMAFTESSGNTSYEAGAISTTTPGSDNIINATSLNVTMPGNGQDSVFPLPVRRVLISGSTTYYLNAFATISNGSVNAYGTIWARRAR